ncbi:MAG: alpha/beta fold hydrolase [Anaerolineales bacterium]|nr:alpha/beta fold hydrolase [Anaerolineales bacterium]NUQ83817.1 alpha/beta fold hydrolase [Anaerolineales bacterium]
MPQIIATAEPFLLLGDRSKPACLLVHGFTGTPKEMRWMGEYLNQNGYTCLGIRLAGHATDPEDMIRSNWTDWVASVEDGFSLLRDSSDAVFLVGLSMGGVLSLLMSTRANVNGVVAMSTPYKLPDDPRLRHIDWIAKMIPYMPKSNEEPGASWFDKEAWKDHISYPQNPVRSIGQLNKLLGEMRAALPKINVPVLLMHSKDDRYVSPENMEMIFEDLKNASDRTKVYLTGSSHVVTRDAARRQVFESALEFIRRVGGQA